MKVLLVNTNRMKPAIGPVGLDYLADTLGATGHEVRLLDLCFSEDPTGDLDRSLKATWPTTEPGQIEGPGQKPRDPGKPSAGPPPTSDLRPLTSGPAPSADTPPESRARPALVRSPGQAVPLLRDFAPQVVGVTVRNTDDCYSNSQAFFLPEIRGLVAHLRQATHAPVVLGGVGFSVAPAAVLEFCQADLGIAGEGELALPELLRALECGSDLAGVPNLLYRADGQVRQNPVTPLDLARLPPRRRDLVDNRLYFARGGQAGFETKRGCAMSCIYCADPVAKGRATRLVPPAAVAAELATLLAQGIDHFHTCDSEFNLPPEHAREVCHALIEAGLGERIRWYAYCTPAPFDEAMAALFQRAGCAGINFGADSGSPEMLRRLGRHFTADDLARAARHCRQHGIACMFDLLLGGSGETRETVRQTLECVRRAEPDCVGLSLGVRVYAGTALARQVAEECDPARHPHLHGARSHNPDFLKPVFYVSPHLGENVTAYVRELVGGDPRFFLPEETPDNRNYNYNDNTLLVQAIERGARGAYWDILRRLKPS